MTEEYFNTIMKKIDIIEKNYLEVIEERDRWRTMYYELKEETDKLMTELREFI